MSEFYKAVFEEYMKRLNENKDGVVDEIFTFIPPSFIQIRKLAMLAATVAEEIHNKNIENKDE